MDLLQETPTVGSLVGGALNDSDRLAPGTRQS